MLNAGELEKLGAGIWQLDCQCITLRPRSPRVQTVNAPGWIRHDEDGNLRFKLLGAGGFDFAHQMLALCVAIEGVVSSEFSDLAKPSSEFLRSCERAWHALERENLDTNFMSRLNGLFGMMKGPSVKDRLGELVKAGVITKSQMKDWDLLRQPSAHGGRSADIPTQQFVDRLFRVMVLFYHLVFAAIGYTGEYTDYGTHGWPTRSYPCRTNTRG